MDDANRFPSRETLVPYDKGPWGRGARSRDPSITKVMDPGS